jgi:WD40 repeat protein
MTGEEITRMTHDYDVNAVDFSPDGKYVVSSSGSIFDMPTRSDLSRKREYGIHVWKVMTGPEVARMTSDSSVNSVAFSPDGGYIVSGSDDGSVRVWQKATEREVARIIHNGEAVASVAFSPNGKYVLSVGDKTTRVWEPNTDKEITRMNQDQYNNSSKFSPDGMYVLSRRLSDAWVWEADTGKEITSITQDKQLWSVAFSPDEKYIVSGSGEIYDRANSDATVWDVTTGAEIIRIPHDFNVFSAVFSPDGKYILTASGLTARVFETFTGKEVVQMPHETVVTSASFSPDGKFILSISNEYSSATVWEANTGKEIARMIHDSGLNSIEFSPDSKYMVSANGNIVHVWETSTGEEITRMFHDNTVNSVSFSPDGRYVVSSGHDKTIRVWMWQPEDLITNTCAYLPRNLSYAEWERYIGDAMPYEAVCPNLPFEPSSSVIQRNYYTFISVWSILLYTIYGWIAYRAIALNASLVPTYEKKGFTWKRLMVAGMQGGLLFTLGLAGLVIISLIIRQNMESKDFMPSLYPLLMLLPSGLWSGGAYSHLTRYQTGKMSKIKRTILGSTAGSLGTFVFIGLILMILAILFFPKPSSLDAALAVLIFSLIFSVLIGILNIFGALIYIFGIQKWILKNSLSRTVTISSVETTTDYSSA